MKKRLSRKQAISMLIALTLVMTVFVGCGKSSQDKQSTNAKESVASNETKKDDKQNEAVEEMTNLKVYTFVAQKQQDEDKVFEEINTYLKDKINADVEINMMEINDYQTKVPLLLSSGETMDLTFASGWANPFLQGVKTGAFLPLDELLDSHGKALKEFLPSSLLDGAKIDGKTYGIPMYKEMGRQYGLYINKELADQYNLDLSSIKTWADLEPIYKELKEKAPDVVGLSNPNELLWTFEVTNVTGSFGRVGAVNADNSQPTLKDVSAGTVVNQYATPEFKEAFDTVRKWYLEGYVPEDPINFGKNGEDLNKAKENKLFSRFIWYAPDAEVNYSAQVGHEFIYIPLQQPIIESDVVTGNVWAIPYTSEHPEKAMELLTLLYTDKKLGTMLRHGVEGVHYVMNDDETISPVEGIELNNRPYDLGMAWWLGTIFNQYIDISQSSVDVFEGYHAYNKDSKPSEAMGFIFDPESSLNEIAAIDNVHKQYFDALANGMVDPDEYLPKYLEGLNQAGVDKLLEEAQRQYDAWKK